MKGRIEQGNAGRHHIGFRLEAVGETRGLRRIGWANWANEWFGRRISAQFVNSEKNALRCIHQAATRSAADGPERAKGRK